VPPPRDRLPARSPSDRREWRATRPRHERDQRRGRKRLQPGKTQYPRQHLRPIPDSIADTTLQDQLHHGRGGEAVAYSPRSLRPCLVFSGAIQFAAIADQAGVAPETVYSIYRSKAGLLDAVVRGAVLRDDEPEEPLERSWVKPLLCLPDLSARIAAFARHAAQTTALTSPIYAMISSAGTGEEELDELQTRLLEMRFGGQRKIMIGLVRGHPLRPGLTAEQAADTFSALASPELHHVLTVRRGWSQRHYAQWLERTAQAALLGDPTQG
jgi:TetR/AcrR family transcriptional regulator, regulator of autoinduction and epiphytic fitness